MKFFRYRKLQPAIQLAKRSGWYSDQRTLWLTEYLALPRVDNGSTASVMHTDAPQVGDTHRWYSSNNKRYRLLFAGDGLRSVYDKSLNITLKTTERNLIVRSDKSKTEGTNNKRLQSRQCAVEVKVKVKVWTLVTAPLT